MDVQFSSIQGIDVIAIQTDHDWIVARSTAALHKQTSAWSGIAGRLWPMGNVWSAAALQAKNEMTL
jgi:hypothetical protein